MSSLTNFQKVVWAVLVLMLSACGARKDEGSAAPSPSAADPITDAVQRGSLNLPLEGVSSDQCLNLEKYFASIRGFPPETKVRKMTTNFRMLSDSGLPRNFYLRLVAGNFQILDADLSATPDFPELKQEGCETLTFTRGDQVLSYKIVSPKKDSLTYLDDWGGQTTVTWLSPLRIQMDRVSVASDNLCDGGDRGKFLVTQEITWGDSSIFTEAMDEKAIDQKFLSAVSTAKGTSLNLLYSSPVMTEPPVESEMGDGDGSHGERALTEWQPVDADRKLLVSRLKELQAMPIRQDLIQCY